MKDVPRIEGTPDPRKTSSTNRDGEIDPEKFKKIMKVDESDESQKRNKRNRAEEDDDVDEEDELQESSAPAPGFSELMDESETRDSLFANKPTAQVSSSQDDDQTGPPGPSPFSMMSNKGDNSPQVPNSPTGLLLPQSSNAPSVDSSEDKQESKSDHRNQVKKMQKNAKKQLTKAIKVAKDEHERTKVARAEQPAEPEKKENVVEGPKVKSTEVEEPESKPPQHKEKIEPIGSSVKSEQEREKKMSESAALFEPEKKRAETSAPATDLELIDLDKKRQKQLQSQLKTGKEEKDHNKDEKNEDELQQIQELNTPAADTTAPQQVETPAYTKLSSQVYDLYERLVGLITVQQYTGHTKTSVKLNMPGSIFNNAEIIIEKANTSPTINVQLFGTPQAVETFNANMADLVAAFQENKRAFEVNISRPYLLKEYRHTIKKAASSREGDKQGGEGDQQDQQAS